MPEVKVLNNVAELNEAIGVGKTDSETVAVIDFWATWCGPCRFISPVFEKIAAEDSSGKILYYKVDVDAAPDIASACGISVMPTFIAYKNGEPLDTMKGANPPALQALIAKVLA